MGHSKEKVARQLKRNKKAEKLERKEKASAKRQKVSEFDEQHKIANEGKEELNARLKAHEQVALEKQKQRIEQDVGNVNDDDNGDGKKKKFDRRDAAQMEALKFRDIKRYRKEMRKVKKELRAERGEPPAVQYCPPPTRAPEVIKEIKQGKWNAMKSKHAKNDFSTRVNHEEPETAADFLNYCLNENKQNLVTIQNILTIQKDVFDITETNERLVKITCQMIDDLQKEEQQGTKRYNVPTILLVTPDTYNVVDLNKLLVDRYKSLSGQDPEQKPGESSHTYDIHVSKLFAKHIKPEEQAALLAKKHPNAKQKRVLNIYVGTPNRLLKLESMEAFDIGKKSDRFRYLVIDCRMNKKNFSIFETKETRGDTIQLIREAKEAILREGNSKLKIALL